MTTEPTPQTIDPGSVISSALQIYRDQASVLLLSAVVVFAVEAVLVFLLGAIGGLLTFIVSTFYYGMVVQLVRDVQDGRRDSSVGDLFRSVAPVVLPLIGVAILATIGIGIGFVLIIIPGLFLMTIWSVVAPVTVIERPGVFNAFGRSRALVKGYGWQVFGVIIVVILVLIVVSVLVSLIASGLGDGGEALVQWAFNVLTAPLLALLVSVLYFGLRRAHGEPAMSDAAPATSPGGAPGGWEPPSSSPPPAPGV